MFIVLSVVSVKENFQHFSNTYDLIIFGHSRVRIDIMSSLKMKDPYVAIGSFDRKNIFYGVKVINRGQSFVDEIVKEISMFVANSGSTIIYCMTIKDVEQVCFHFSFILFST